MKKLLNFSLACLLLVATLVTAVPAQAFAAPGGNSGKPETTEPKEKEDEPEGICENTGDGWGLKIDLDLKEDTYEVFAPSGYLIDKYCIKAGSIKQGFGPVEVVVDPPASSVFIDYPGKDSISHYQLHIIAKSEASASVSKEPATCLVGEKLVYGPIFNATYSGTADGTTAVDTPIDYSVTATADFDAEFAGGDLTQTFTGTLAAKISSRICNPPSVASASVSKTDADCTTGEKLVYGPIFNATYSGTADGTTAVDTPIDYSVTATADANAEFAGGATSQDFTGTLAAKKTGGDCEQPEVKEATASVTIDAGNCETPGKLTYNVNSWLNSVLLGGSTPTGTTGGPTNYTVTAQATANAEFQDANGGVISDSGKRLTFEGILDAQQTGDDCVLGETPEEPPVEVPGTPVTPEESPEVLPATSSNQSFTSLLFAITSFVGLVALGTHLIRSTSSRNL